MAVSSVPEAATAGTGPARADIISCCQAAFKLGWHVAALSADSPSQPPTAAATDERALGLLMPNELPDLDRIEGPQRWSALIDLIGADASQMGIEHCPKDDAVQMNTFLLTALTRADFRWVKAYTLGTGLERVTMHFEPWDPALRSQRMWELSQRLTDLKSCFQPYAADAVASTLSVWAKRVERSGPTASATDMQALCRQGQIWRTLLSGEKLATDNLQVPDYLAGAQHVTSTMWLLAHRTFTGARALLGVTLSVGVTALVVAVLLATRGQLGLALGAISLGLGWLGITSASVGATAKQAVGAIEKDLWQAELSAAIASSIYVEVRDTGDASAIEKLRRPRASTARFGT